MGGIVAGESRSDVINVSADSVDLCGSMNSAREWSQMSSVVACQRWLGMRLC